MQNQISENVWVTHKPAGDYEPQYRLEVDVLSQLFDYIDYPMVLLDATGTLVWSNDQGRDVVASEHLLMIRDGKVVPTLREFQNRWNDQIEAASTGEEALVFIDGETSGQAISIIPLSQSRIRLSDQPEYHYRLLAVILGKDLPCKPLALRRFSGSYRLTPAEQRIVAQLLKGLTPSTIANINEVAMSTVRAQIKSILSKTGSTSMRNLLLSISRLPPLKMVR